MIASPSPSGCNIFPAMKNVDETFGTSQEGVSPPTLSHMGKCCISQNTF